MSILKKYLDMPNDSQQKTIAVALALCLVCSILVSAAAVALKPRQEANKAADKKENIRKIAGMMFGHDHHTPCSHVHPRGQSDAQPGHGGGCGEDAND